MRNFRVDEKGKYKFKYWNGGLLLLPLVFVGCPGSHVIGNCFQHACRHSTSVEPSKPITAIHSATRVSAAKEVTKAVAKESFVEGVGRQLATEAVVRIVIHGVVHYSSPSEDARVLPEIISTKQKQATLNVGYDDGIEVGSVYILFRESDETQHYVCKLFIESAESHQAKGTVREIKLTPMMGDKARHENRFQRDD